jgi:hypothetical protein
MQKALVVGNDVSGLNEFLMAGWTVANTCAMPSSIGGQNYSTVSPTCLVIIERDEA